MKRSTIAILAALLLSPLTAQADHRHHGHDHRYKGYDYAKVVDVDPIYERVGYRVPRQECWNEQVRVDYRRNDSYTDEIVGAVIGGAIGNAIGHNDSNKKVQAVIGAALGASIANDLNDRGYAGHSYRNERRCAHTEDVEYHEEVTGYRVAYRYRGRIYHTRTAHHPGKRIRVKVNVRPML
ncbi:glycine zipper 2TM domain-containing protein [Marinobacterium arenosum]|uniref:glycine zipper 2TM domain-containing protein n=1 Tax=Marinobacterium arenosum TaxID=2862496 RepID=UPI001C98CAF9|nr:glycine zipper 2TM domain-containing protein [Marinobacterium arenosum]MBY4676459.1 glycine zipper 2TM domain-containing protein [Marinobacterium arenosum]